MKKIMFLSIMVLTLAAVSAYAGESASWALTHGDNLPHNGITVFSKGAVEFDNVPLGAGFTNSLYAEGSAAGSWRGEEAMAEPYTYNGITILSEGPVAYDTVMWGNEEMTASFEEGSAAGGLHEEEAVVLPENGITIFSTEPVSYDSVPAAW